MTEQNQVTKILLANSEFWSDATGDALIKERMEFFRDFLHTRLAHHEQVYDKRGYIGGEHYAGKENPNEPGSFKQHLNIYAVFGGDIPDPVDRSSRVPEEVLREVESHFECSVFIVPFFLDDQSERVQVIQATRHCEALALHHQQNVLTGGFVYSLGFVLQHDLDPDQPHVYHVARGKTHELGLKLSRPVPEALKSKPAWVIIHTKSLSGRVIAIHEYLLFTDQFGPIEKATPAKAIEVTDHVLSQYGNLLKIAHDEYCSIHVDTLVVPEKTDA